MSNEPPIVPSSIRFPDTPSPFVDIPPTSTRDPFRDMENARAFGVEAARSASCKGSPMVRREAGSKRLATREPRSLT